VRRGQIFRRKVALFHVGSSSSVSRLCRSILREDPKWLPWIVSYDVCNMQWLTCLTLECIVQGGNDSYKSKAKCQNLSQDHNAIRLLKCRWKPRPMKYCRCNKDLSNTWPSWKLFFKPLPAASGQQNHWGNKLNTYELAVRWQTETVFKNENTNKA